MARARGQDNRPVQAILRSRILQRLRLILTSQMIYPFSMAGRGHRNGTILKTLWVKDDSGCWLWVGCIHKATGYGKKQWHGIALLAHRWMYEQRVGPIPDGMVIDHTCNVRHCVNPDHLQPMTQSENVQKCMDENRHPNKGKKYWGANEEGEHHGS